MKKILLKAFMLVMLMCVSVGAWADVVTETFENQSTSTTYNGQVTYEASASNAGISWYVEHGTVATNGVITGSNSMHMRAYYAANSAEGTWNGALPYVETKTPIKGLQSFTFNAAVSNTNLKMEVSYSTDGSSWTQIGTTKTFSNTSADNAGTFEIPSSNAATNYYIKIAASSSSTHVAKPSKSGNYTFRIDDVAFTYAAATTAYTVSFDGNSHGTPASASIKEASAGAGITLPGCTADAGYSFKGWADAADATSANVGAAGASYNPTDDVTLYAYYVPTYTLSITQPAAGGTLTVSDANGALATGATVEVGTNLTCEVTDIPEGKRFSRFYVNYDGDGSIYKTTNPATFDNIPTEGITAATITVAYQDLSQYTINYMVNGENTNAQENTWEGTPLVFPTPVAIYGKQFMGWVETEIDGTTNTAPSFVNIEGLTATANKTYYAVFANVEENPETWNKVTDASSLEENDVIAIVSSEAVDYNIKGNTTKYNGYIAMGKTQNSNNRAGEVVIVADDVLTINDNVQQVTLTKATFNENTDWQLGVDGGFLYANNSSSNYLKTQETNDVNGLWNISITDGKATIYAKYSSFTRKYIRVNGNYANSTTNAPLVTAYKSDATTGVLASIYKKEGGNTYSEYCTTVTAPSFDVTISAAGYSTLYLDYAVTIPDGVQAFTGVLNGNKLTMTELSDVIPAKTAVVLKAAEASYTFEATAYATFSGSNHLKGCLIATATNTIGGGTVCTLANGEDGVGFYKYTGENLGANKAYLVVPENQARVTMSFDDEESAIETVEVEKQNNDMFDLMGRRTNNKTGLRIVNGKKVMLME